MIKRIAFISLTAAGLLPIIGPATALTAGILFSIIFGNPWPKHSSVWSKRLLQLSVVGLGFGISILDVWRVGKASILVTIVGISFTLLTGRMLANLFQTRGNTATLISFGTAICGGSAIAAMAPVIKARDDEIAVSLATVFSLNALALLIFPPIGRLAGLSPQEFGVWSAIAIHDTSSVVGAAAAFGGGALAIATTVKLARAIWITPCVMIAAWHSKSGNKAGIPLFIIGFIAAACLRSLLPDLSAMWDGISTAARQGLVVTLFLVGSGLNREVIKRIGVQPLAYGMTLWLIVSALTLLAIAKGLVPAL